MKSIFSAAIGTFIFLSITVIFQGCVKDTYQKTYSYTYYIPVYKTPEQVMDNIKSNPAQPVTRPGKIYIRGNYIFLNEIDKGIHVIDNSNPSHPNNIAFIDIPGNMDMAVKGNTLYADLYGDLVAIDISDPQSVSLKKTIRNIFPERSYYNFLMDQSRIIVDWIKRDTVITEKGKMQDFLRRRDIFIMYSADVSLQSGSGASMPGANSVSPYGVGGSMSRFTLANERLYTVNRSSLNIFNVTTEQDPLKTETKNIGLNIETIFPFKNVLLIGSQSGMFIYNVSVPDNPVQMGKFGHVDSCDPVIAEGEYAYVTLSSGRACQGFSNELEVLKLNNLTDPSLLKVYQMTNPRGLSKYGNALFICDSKDGVKIYDASDATNLKMIRQITGIEAYDVITLNDMAIISAKDGLYQYDISNLHNVHMLSKIGLIN